VDNQDRNLRVALDEIERLMADAERHGTSVPAWFAELAAELRAAAPAAGGEVKPDLAERILSDPRLSIGAHAKLHPGALRILND